MPPGWWHGWQVARAGTVDVMQHRPALYCHMLRMCFVINNVQQAALHCTAPHVLTCWLCLPPWPAQARKAAGIVARSKVQILAAEQDMYVSRTTGELMSRDCRG